MQAAMKGAAAQAMIAAWTRMGFMWGQTMLAVASLSQNQPTAAAMKAAVAPVKRSTRRRLGSGGEVQPLG